MSILQKSRGLFQNITKTKVFKKTVMKTNLKKPTLQGYAINSSK